MDAVDRLLDIEEIKKLKARYFRFLDTKQWDRWGEVFTAGVHMEVLEAAVVLDGREAVVENVSAALEGAVTAHHGYMPEIEMTDRDYARGTWAMTDYVEWPAGEDGRRVGLRGYGHYVEEYVREEGQWRIATTRLDRLRVDQLS